MVHRPGNRARHRRRGIFLIGVMLLAVLVAMFVGASFEVGVWGFKQNVSQSDVAAAQRAARSGLAYVLGRLRNHPTWKADTATNIVVNDPDLVVVEERGNIIGLMRSGDRVSQFRVRFNYYDGGVAGTDGITADPAGQMKFDWARVSVNNFEGTAAVNIPRVDGPGSSVLASPAVYGELPSRGVFVAVQGRSGRWLSQATAANPDPPLPVGQKASVSSIETVYKMITPPQGSNAVAGSSGNFFAQVGTADAKKNVSLETSDATKIPRIRSRGDLRVLGGKPGNDNLVAGKKGGQYGAVGAILDVVTSTATQVVEGPADPLLGVGWGALEKAAPSATPTDNVLAAGVYSVWDDGTLHYYDTDLAGYRALMLADPSNAGTTSPPLPSSMQFSFGGGKAKLQVKQSTFVQSTANTADLTFIPKVGVDAGPGVADPDLKQIGTVTDSLRADKVTLEFKPSTSSSAVITTSGKFNLGAKLTGDGGSVTAENDINVVCMGVDLSAYSNPKEGVSLYTKKDLTMSTYDDSGSGSYKKAALKGVVYAWGDIKVKLGDATVPENKWGKFDLTGAIVAYGKDPSDLINPAAPANIDIVASEVNFKYDESYVQGILSGIPANFQMQRVRWLQN